jgi:hypothetical protein
MSDKPQTMLEVILERFPEDEFLKADGFDSAIIGVDTTSMRLVYSEKECIELLCLEGMDFEEALEHFDFNVKGAYMGDKTPIWVLNYF